MDMDIPKGSIYGLLGPSGCGKTTLIHCIIGKKKLASGELSVFGEIPGSNYSGIPADKIGYMPQELALTLELTMVETLKYFGNIFNMSDEKIASRSDFLIDLLDLPREARSIKNLSVGQQRRVSLAAALIHEPELLILDEPTVGVDPMLRRCIWSHLLEIIKASNFQTTIVITTHYIEEARQANVIGMIRFGRLLAEGPPEQLLVLYKKTSLEEVFVFLCLKDEITNSAGESLQAKTRGIERRRCKRKVSVPIETDACQHHGYKKEVGKWYALSGHRTMALVLRNTIRIKRSAFFIALLLIIPIFDLITVHFAIGHQPRGLTIAVVNEEIRNDSCEHLTNGCIFFKNSTTHKLDSGDLGCRYISHLGRNLIHPVFYQSLEKAEQAVQIGKHWGVMHFKVNYTSALVIRYMGAIFDPDKDKDNQSDIYVSLDMSNHVVGFFLQSKILRAYQEFAHDILTSCNLETKRARPPIVYEAPIYGTPEPTFTEFAIAGLMVAYTYYLSASNTALSIILDKRDGVADRERVAGVTPIEVVLASLAIHLVILTVQVAIMLAISTMLFQTDVQGSLIDCALLLILQGVCGMSFGFAIGALVDTVHEAVMIDLGSLLCSLHLCGLVWPLEGMPDLLQYFSYMLPNTLASEAYRSIVVRGWDSSWVQVELAYLVTIIWTILQVVVSVGILQLKR